MNASPHLASRANRNWLVPLLIAALHGTGIAALNIPSDGSDGALVITQNTEIDLGRAVTNRWDANNSVNAGMGIYDPEKWAVVFKYSSVTVQGGATVTFKNHPSRAPVVWLVQGDVTINGTVNLSGQNGIAPPGLAEPGPGGFRGGTGDIGPGAGASSGFGPGGAVRNGASGQGAGGSYGSVGQYGPKTYGNPSLIPLVGGSGGGGAIDWARGGGAGGGAILLACSGTLSISGSIVSNGGKWQGDARAGGGSGGGIRLVAHTLAGAGSLTCLGGAGYGAGGVGRIRIERVTPAYSIQPTPDADVVALADNASPRIWMPESGPVVRVVSVGGQAAPPDPAAAFGTVGADLVLPQTTGTTVVVETTNVESASVVTVRVSPRANANFTETTATVSSIVSEDPLVIRWVANVPVKDGYSAIQVKVVRP